jgi:hypothetical protein
MPVGLRPFRQVDPVANENKDYASGVGGGASRSLLT